MAINAGSPRIHLALDEETYESLRALAKENDRTILQELRRAIRRHLDNHLLREETKA